MSQFQKKMKIKELYQTQRNVTPIFNLTTNCVYTASYTFQPKFKLALEVKSCSYVSNEYISEMTRFTESCIFNVHLTITF